MSIDIHWEEMRWRIALPDQPGESHILATLRDDHSLVQHFLIRSRVSDFPYLSFISHESVTVFHQQHIPQLIKESEALSEQDFAPDVKVQLHAALDFVRRACGSRNTHIAFEAR
jgi:hypothetical protein